MLQVLQGVQNAGRGNIFCAYAIVTAPVIYSTAAGTGGPLLWNGSSATVGAGKVNAFLLAVSFGLSTASTVAGAIGITGNISQPNAPTSTTAIDAVGNYGVIGGQASQCTAYRIGTVAVAGGVFYPMGMVHTGPVTVDTTDENWQDLGGILVAPGSWASVAGSATLTTAVMQVGLIWQEVPA